jgi:hypothetical protein
MSMHRALAAVLFAVSLPLVAMAEDQVPPKQDELRELHTTIAYSDEAIRNFVETEFAKSNLDVKTEPVIAILIRDLAKDGAGGFRIGPEDLDYTFEYRRVGEDVQIEKITK